MARTTVPVRALREMVDEARGVMPLTVVALELGWSGQRLSQKLSGERGLKVPEVLEIAKALHLDPVQALVAEWPDIGTADRLAGIRLRLADATDDEIADVEAWLDRRQQSKSKKEPRATA